MGELSNPRYERISGGREYLSFYDASAVEEVIHGYRVWARFVEEADPQRGN
jgi:hypothetical protein